MAIPTIKNTSQIIETRYIGRKKETTRPDRPLECMEMLSEKLNLRLSQVIDSLMNILQVEISRAFNSAINDRVISEIQKVFRSMSFGQRDTDTEMPTNNQDMSEKTNGLNTKLTRKDSKSTFDQRHWGPKSLQF